MAASAAGKFVGVLCALKGSSGRLQLGYVSPACTLLQTRNYAARKGTREKARKKKVKVEVKKIGFIPHKDRDTASMVVPIHQLKLDDFWKQDIPPDNVWIGKYYKWKRFSFEEAVNCYKETHQFGLYDAPDAFITAKIELDMKGPKPSRPVTRFSRLVPAPHPFDHGETRNVAVFCKTPELQEEATNAGAHLVGGPELIPRIQSGEVTVSEYDYVLAHPNMMAEIVALKGLLKRKFPGPTTGTLGADITGMVKKFLYGIKYSGHPHERQPLFGVGESAFGRLNMDAKQLEENFIAVVDDIMAHRPKRPGPFITKLRLASEVSKEVLLLDHNLYVKEEKTVVDDGIDDDDDEEVAVAI